MTALIDDLIRAAEAVGRHYLTRPLLRDPADHHVVETAVNGQADLLVVGPGEALEALRYLKV